MTPPAAGADGSGRMFDGIARRYDLLNRLISLGLDRGWRRRMVDALALPTGGRACDVACGTCDVSLEIRRRHPDVEVVALDASARMLEVAADKLARAGVGAGEDGPAGVHLVHGDATALPFPSATFDACAIAFGIRNVVDRPAALREMVRVLKPGGRLVVLELTDPRGGWLDWPARLHVHHLVPWLGGLLSGSAEYRYLSRSIAAFPPPEAFVGQLADAGLREVSAERLALGALYLYRGRTQAA